MSDIDLSLKRLYLKKCKKTSGKYTVKKLKNIGEIHCKKNVKKLKKVGEFRAGQKNSFYDFPIIFIQKWVDGWSKFHFFTEVN